MPKTVRRLASKLHHMYIFARRFLKGSYYSARSRWDMGTFEATSKIFSLRVEFLPTVLLLQPSQKVPKIIINLKITDIIQSLYTC